LVTIVGDGQHADVDENICLQTKQSNCDRCTTCRVTCKPGLRMCLRAVLLSVFKVLSRHWAKAGMLWAVGCWLSDWESIRYQPLTGGRERMDLPEVFIRQCEMRIVPEGCALSQTQRSSAVYIR